MKKFKIILQRHGPWITPPAADTWFGHICWAYKYLFGENKLIELLNLFIENPENPPWLISDAFPENFLPLPTMPKILSKYENINDFKKFKKQYLIHERAFFEMEQFSFDYLAVPYISSPKKHVWDDRDDDVKEIYFGFAVEPTENPVKPIDITHNSIDRFTNSTLQEGGFFHTSVKWAKENSKLQLFINVNEKHLDDLKKALEFIEISGFGKDKSTGAGHFVISDWIENPLQKVDNPNAFMSISSCVPSENDTTDVYYSIKVKYGKLGGDWASQNPEINHPYKKPLIMFQPGAIFKDKPVGSIIKNIHSDSRIVHYALAFPFPVNINEEDLP